MTDLLFKNTHIKNDNMTGLKWINNPRAKVSTCKHFPTDSQKDSVKKKHNIVCAYFIDLSDIFHEIH